MCRMTAWTWLRSRSVPRRAWQLRVGQAGVDVDRGAELVTEERQAGVAQRERRVQGHGGGDGLQGAFLELSRGSTPRLYDATDSALPVSASPYRSAHPTKPQ